MKIRTGFVSNSSSSSFVIMSDKETIKQALSLLTPKQKKFIKNEILGIAEREKVIVDGKQYVLYFGTYYTDNWPVDDGVGHTFEGEEECFEAIRLFERNVKPLCFIKEY